MRIMVVDDSIIIRSQIEKVLQGTELEFVGSAVDGSDALRQFEELRPQLVTMDLTMPRVNGVDAIRHMVRMDPDVRILVISALRDKSTALRAIRAGGHGFLYKPFTVLELTQALNQLIEDL